MAAEEECCHLLDGKEWQGKTVEWKDKPFVKDSYFALFYVPQGVEKKIVKWMDALASRKLTPKDDVMMLWRNEALFGGELLIAAAKYDPGLPMEKLSGKFFTMFFEGKSYSEAGRWHSEFGKEAARRGLKTRERMTCYAVCPGCSQKFGKVQAIVFGRL